MCSVCESGKYGTITLAYISLPEEPINKAGAVLYLNHRYMKNKTLQYCMNRSCEQKTWKDATLNPNKKDRHLTIKTPTDNLTHGLD